MSVAILKPVPASSSSQPTVHIEMRLPAPKLRPYVSGYQLITVDGPVGSAVEDLIYPGWANLRCAIVGRWSVTIGGRSYDPAPPQVLYGPSSVAGRVTARPGVLAGAGLTPLGWSRLIGAHAGTFADRLTPLGEVLGEALQPLVSLLAADASADGVARAYDTVLVERLSAAPEPPELVVRFHRLVTDAEVGDVESLSRALGLSPRQLSRLSLRLFGFPPKLLLQRHRFLSTLMAIREGAAGSWSRQLDPRYYDQAHFVRDCRKFLGMSPSAFLALPRPILEASTRARLALLGTGAQGLQKPGPISPSAASR